MLAGAPEKRSEPSGSRFDVSGSRPRAAHGPRVVVCIRSRSGQRRRGASEQSPYFDGTRSADSSSAATRFHRVPPLRSAASRGAPCPGRYPRRQRCRDSILPRRRPRQSGTLHLRTQDSRIRRSPRRSRNFFVVAVRVRFEDPVRRPIGAMKCWLARRRNGPNRQEVASCVRLPPSGAHGPRVIRSRSGQLSRFEQQPASPR